MELAATPKCVAPAHLTAQPTTSDPNVYEYVSSSNSPLEFQEGDTVNNSACNIPYYYQESTGPQNHRQSGLVSPTANKHVALLQSDEYDYHFVTVVTGENH